MITIAIPSFGQLTLTHLVLDYNGTLAIDGRLLDGVRVELDRLADEIDIHVVTGNAYGNADHFLDGLKLTVMSLPSQHQAVEKRRYVERIGADQTVAIGNGRNDAAMLKTAALGIAVLGVEGAALDAIMSADMIVRHVVDGLGLLLQPKRLMATLRA